MTSSRARGARPWRAPALLLLLALASACSRGDGSSASGVPDDPAIYDFVLEHPRAERAGVLLVVDPVSPDQVQLLEDGWTLPSEDPGQAALWSDSRSAAISFLVPETGPLEFETYAKAMVDPEDTNPTRVFFNDQELGEVAVGPKWTPLRFELPENLQRVGRNHLRFEFEQLNPVHAIRGGAPRPQRFSVLFQPFELGPGDEQVRERWKRLNPLGPDGSRTQVDSEELPVIDQSPSALLAFHVEVPPDGRFYTRLGLAPLETGEPGSGKLAFEVRVTPDGGQPVSLDARQLTAADAPVDVDLPLADFEGQVVRVDLCVSPANARGWERLGRWTAPRIVVDADDLREAAERELESRDDFAVDELRSVTESAPIVMILIDACNASFVSAYGGREGLTPHIDRLAQEGARFEQAFASASYTISSVASMFTSQWAWQHGSYTQETKLGDSVHVWPERFSEEGYRTVSIVHSPFGSSQLGYGRGFEERYDVFRSSQLDRPPLAADALPALDEALEKEDGRPLFLWMHIVEPHRPYTPPAPFAGRYSAGIESELDGTTDSSNKIKDRVHLPTPEDIAYQRAIYEENLGYADQVIGEIRARLDAAGIFEEAIVCLFSDHGEGFLDHNGKVMPGIGHGMQTYNDMTRVPLIFRLPEEAGIAGRVPRSVASTIDLLPTVADLAGLDGLERIPGQSLARALCTPDSSVRRATISHSYVKLSERFLPMWGHWWEDYKLIFHQGNAPELYDLATDPDERNDLAGERPIMTAFLLQQLNATTGLDVRLGELDLELTEGGDYDAATLEQLRALGYIR